MLLLLLYVLVKFAAYTAWCALALRILDGRGPHDVRGALLWGALRLLLGVAVGLFIFVAALSMNNATRNAPLTYVAIYIPVSGSRSGCSWMSSFVGGRLPGRAISPGSQVAW